MTFEYNSYILDRRSKYEMYFGLYRVYHSIMAEELKSEWVQVAEEMIREPSASLQEIADRTGIPKSTVWYTQKRLQEEELIEQNTFFQIDKIDSLKVGIIGGAINGDKEDVLEKVASHPNVWFLVDTVGPHSFVATLVGKDSDEFQEVIETLNSYGAEGAHYNEVTGIPKFGTDAEFIQTLREQE